MARSFVAALFSLAFMMGGASAQCTVPNNLTNGTNASASQVMANFNAILTCVNNINPQVVLPGFVNKLRNSSLTSWFHGSTVTITTSGGWGAEGIYIVPAGASVTAQQAASGLSNALTFWSETITGNASVTDVTVRFPVESFDAAPLAGQQVTCQIPVLNNTGGSITPTLTVKRANAQDSGYINTDVNAAALQTIANGATGTLAYSWTANGLSSKGLSIDIDFGNNFSATGKSIQVGGGFDCHVTPGVPTGTVASPPAPIIPPAATDTVWNLRYYEASYESGTAPGAATHTGMQAAFNAWGTGNSARQSGLLTFKVLKRADPSMSFWDGAGNSNVSSERNGATWVDNQCTVALGIAGMTSAVVDQTNCGSGQTGSNLFVHYTADATLTGG